MTLDEALLYDAEWWIKRKTNYVYDMEVSKLVDPVRSYWAKGHEFVDYYPAEQDCFFNLLIREAIKDDATH